MDICGNSEAAREFTIYQHLVRCPVLYPDRYDHEDRRYRSIPVISYSEDFICCVTYLANRFILAVLIFFANVVTGLGFPKTPDDTYLKTTLTSDTIVSTYQADGLESRCQLFDYCEEADA